MVQIANLVLGLEFKNLLIEVTQVEGIDPESKPEDPAHTAIVGDSTGHIRLVYRASTAVRPTQVKKGKTYLIAGKFLLELYCQLERPTGPESEAQAVWLSQAK